MKLSVNERKVLILSLTALIVAVVTFGVLNSTGTFEKDEWKLGGAIVGYLAALYAMNKIYGRVITTDLNRLHGQWWELLKDHEQIAICHVRFNCLNSENKIYIYGKAYSKNGKEVVTWKSYNAVYTQNERKLFYYWEYQKELSGIGFLQFMSSTHKGQFNSGNGWYTTGNLVNLKILKKHHVLMRRLTKKELKIWKSDKPEAKEQLIISVYNSWRDRLAPGDTFREKS